MVVVMMMKIKMLRMMEMMVVMVVLMMMMIQGHKHNMSYHTTKLHTCKATKIQGTVMLALRKQP